MIDNNIPEEEILQAMVEVIWDEYGDSFESANMFNSKKQFLNTFRRKAIEKIYELRREKEKEVQKDAELKAYGKCPECGKQMVKRSGPYGDFLGCSGYPKCNHKGKMRDIVIPKVIPKVQVEKRKVSLMDGPDWDDEEVQTCGDVYPQALGWGKDTFM